MATPYRQPQPPDRPRELAVDQSPPLGLRVYQLIVVAVVIGGLLVALRTRGAIVPLVVLPLGLGAGGWLTSRLRRRVLRLARGTLSLHTRGLFASRRIGSLRVADGVFVSASPTGLNVNFEQEMELSLVGSRGRFAFRLLGRERTLLLVQGIKQLLGDAGVAVLENPHEPLAGAVEERSLEGGVTELVWREPSGVHGDPTWGIVSIALVFVLFSALATRVGLGGLSVVALFVLAALVLTRYWTGPRRASRVTLRIGPEAWWIQRPGPRKGGRVSGTGKLRARIVAGRGVELESAGEHVAVVGQGLTEPEQRWLGERIAQAAAD